MKTEQNTERPCVHAFNPITDADLFHIGRHVMGGGLSQSYAALYLLEYYCELRNFDEVIEIGTQQGGLSLFLANLAAVTEWFNFATFDIDDWPFNTRTNGGVGHWYRRLADLDPYRIAFHHLDCFCAEAIHIIREKISRGKTLIICDGGHKIEEFKTFAPMLRLDDCILPHDWGGKEISMEDVLPVIKEWELEPDCPFDEYFGDMGTLFMPFVKKTTQSKSSAS